MPVVTRRRRERPVFIDQPDLTARELQIAIAIGNGSSYPEVSRQLKIGYETVRYHVTNLRNKTGRNCKSQLAIWASQRRKWLTTQLKGRGT